MFRRLLWLAVAACIGCVFAVSPVFSSDYGCKVLLCLMNPGGATEFRECEPTIRKFKRDMYLGRPFPKCDMGSDSGVEVKQGKQPYKPCAEAYGDDFEPYDQPNDSDTEHYYSPVSNGSNENYPDGHNYNERTVCRRYLGTQPVRHCQYNDNGRLVEETCYYTDEPMYDTQPAVRNEASRYVQTYLNGEAQGEKFHYKKKKKKRGW